MFIKYPKWDFKHSAITLSSEMAKSLSINTIVSPNVASVGKHWFEYLSTEWQSNAVLFYTYGQCHLFLLLIFLTIFLVSRVIRPFLVLFLSLLLFSSQNLRRAYCSP